jgi:hypothetical protein
MPAGLHDQKFVVMASVFHPNDVRLDKSLRQSVEQERATPAWPF